MMSINFMNPRLRRSYIHLLALLTVLFPANISFAEKATTSDQKIVETEVSNVNIKNYLESEDFLMTAERIPSNRWDIPANVYVITAQEIEDNHYQTIEEALSHINGVVIETAGVRASTSRVNEGYRVLLLVDGHRVNTSQGDYPLDEKSDVRWFPSIKVVDRIEIVKGGSSALYGTDAVDGVINIITKKGTHNETTVDVNSGTWHRHNYEITNQGILGNFGWFISGGLYKSQPFGFKDEGIYRYYETNYSDKSFFIRLDQRFDKGSSLTFNVLHRGHDYTPIEDYRNINTNFLLSYNFKESKSVPGWLRLFHMSYTEHQNIVAEVEQRMNGVEYQNGWEFNRHKIIAGAEWHQNRALDKHSDYPVLVKYTRYDEKVDNVAFYIQDKISLGNKWKIVPGIRLDHTKEFGYNKSPKIAANYRPDEKTKFYASWGRVYRTPSIGEYYTVNYGLMPGTYDYVYFYGGYYSHLLFPEAISSLTYEKGHAETVGVEHNFDSSTGASLNFFNNSINNSVSQYYMSTDDGSWVVVVYNDFGWKEKHRGVAFDFHQKLGNHFDYNIGYTHTNLIYVSTQPNTWRVGLHYKNRGLKANLLGIMAHGLYTYGDIIDPYGNNGFFSSKQAAFDFNFSYDVNKNVTTYFRLNNFTNQNFNGKGKAADLPGRAFIGGITFRF